MPKCKCGKSFPKERKKLGYKNCLDCAAIEAEKEKQEKSKRIVALHKGHLTYLGSDVETQKKNLLGISNMRHTKSS